MNKVLMKGNELTLAGELPELNSQILNFKLFTNSLSVKSNEAYEGRVLILLTVPSLDTGVCDMEVRKFNQEAASLSGDVSVVAVSTDLPFAQARWCAAAGIKNVETLSDYMSVEFGKNYGVLINELRLLARAVFVFNRHGTLVYQELVKETTNEPNYNAALEAVKQALKDSK